MSRFTKLLRTARRRQTLDATIDLLQHFEELFPYMVLTGQPDSARFTVMQTTSAWLGQQLDTLPADEEEMRILLFKKVRSLLTLPGESSPFTFEVTPEEMFASLSSVNPMLLTKQREIQAALTKEEFEVWALSVVGKVLPPDAAAILELSVGKVMRIHELADSKIQSIIQ